MTPTPPVTVTRHAAYDEVTWADPAARAAALWAVLEGMSRIPPDPPGAAPPFCPLPGPAAGFRVPPAAGDMLLAMTPAADVVVVDRRGDLAVPLDPARLSHRAGIFQDTARAIAAVPRGAVTTEHPGHVPALAGLIAEACGPAGGVALVRDGPQAEQVAYWYATYRVPARTAPARRPRPDLPPPRDPDGWLRAPPGTWLIVPAGHPAWATGRIPDPPVVVAVDPLAACRPKVLGRLFARPDQRVYGLVRTDRGHPAAAVHRLHAAYGWPVHAVGRA